MFGGHSTDTENNNTVKYDTLGLTHIHNYNIFGSGPKCIRV